MRSDADRIAFDLETARLACASAQATLRRLQDLVNAGALSPNCGTIQRQRRRVAQWEQQREQQAKLLGEATMRRIPSPTPDPHLLPVTPALRDLFERYAEGFDDTDPSFRKQLAECLGATTLSKSLQAWMDAFAPEVLG